MIAFILVVIGGLNWGLVGLGEWFGSGYNWNLVWILLGKWPMVEGLVYILVAISTVILICSHKKDCKTCDSKSAPAAGQQM